MEKTDYVLSIIEITSLAGSTGSGFGGRMAEEISEVI